MYNLDLHVHSIFSQDSNLHPERIIKIAKRKGLSGIAITDHDTIDGAIKTKSLADKDFMVIPGSEITTDKGDVIGLFLNENIKSRRFIDVIDDIKDQGGISILPHPYKNKLADPAELISYVDIIERLNARITRKLNDKAYILSRTFGKRIVAGSDAHTSFEIGRVRTIFLEEPSIGSIDDVKKYLLNGRVGFQGNESPYHIRMFSTGMGRYKKDGMRKLIISGLHKISRG